MQSSYLVVLCFSFSALFQSCAMEPQKPKQKQKRTRPDYSLFNPSKKRSVQPWFEKPKSSLSNDMKQILRNPNIKLSDFKQQVAVPCAPSDPDAARKARYVTKYRENLLYLKEILSVNTQVPVLSDLEILAQAAILCRNRQPEGKQ